MVKQKPPAWQKRLLTYLGVGLLVTIGWFIAFWAMGYLNTPTQQAEARSKAKAKKRLANPPQRIKCLVLSDLEESKNRRRSGFEVVESRKVPGGLDARQLMDIVDDAATNHEFDFAYCEMTSLPYGVETFTLHPDIQCRSNIARDRTLAGTTSQAYSNQGLSWVRARQKGRSRPLIRVEATLPDVAELEWLDRHFLKIVDSGNTPRCMRVIGTLQAPGTIDEVVEFRCNVSPSNANKIKPWSATAVLFVEGKQFGKRESLALSTKQLAPFFFEAAQSLFHELDPKIVYRPKAASDGSEGLLGFVDRAARIGQLKAIDLASRAFLLAPDSPSAHQAVLRSHVLLTQFEENRSKDEPIARLDHILQNSTAALEFLQKRLADPDTDWDACQIILPSFQLASFPKELQEDAAARVRSYRRQLRNAIVQALQRHDGAPPAKETLFLRGLRWLDHSPEWYGETLDQSLEFRRQLLAATSDLEGRDYLVESLLLTGVTANNRDHTRALRDDLDQDTRQRLSQVSQWNRRFFRPTSDRSNGDDRPDGDNQ